MSDTPTNIQISSEINDKLEEMAQTTNRPKEEIVEEALQNFLKVKAWQKKAIQEAIEEADRGEGIPHEEVFRQLREFVNKKRKTLQP